MFHAPSGEALHPDREPAEILDRIRRTIGEYNFAGQISAGACPVKYLAVSLVTAWVQSGALVRLASSLSRRSSERATSTPLC